MRSCSASPSIASTHLQEAKANSSSEKAGILFGKARKLGATIFLSGENDRDRLPQGEELVEGGEERGAHPLQDDQWQKIPSVNSA
jgi:hypothetical protein